MTEVPALPSSADPAPAISALELINVVVESFSAELKALNKVEAANLSLGVFWARQDDGRLLSRFSATCLLLDQELEDKESSFEGHLLASLQCEIVLEYGPTDPENVDIDTLSSEVIDSFARKVAMADAFPYIREAISSMSTRLGFPRVTLGVFRPNEEMFFTTGSIG